MLQFRQQGLQHFAQNRLMKPKKHFHPTGGEILKVTQFHPKTLQYSPLPATSSEHLFNPPILGLTNEVFLPIVA
jgi:hypothetical protein